MNKKFTFKILEDIFVIDSRNEYESQLMQQCFDIVGVFVAAVDLKGNITLINKKGKALLEQKKDEIVGRNFIENFIAPEEQSRTKNLFNQVIREKITYPESTRYSLRTLSNHTIIIEARNVTIRDRNGNILGILISGEDVTGYLDNQRMMLQDDIKNKEYAENLRKAKEDAEQANQTKSEFLARVSHEIRTPLNAILGFTEQLMQTRLNKKQEEYVKIIDKSSEHLLSLINDILIISKIEAHEISFDSAPFNLAHIIEYVYNALEGKAKEKKLRFTYDLDQNLDTVLIGDSFRLRQILINLLNNAIKFTLSGYVELKCYLKEETRDEAKIRFDIIDTGIGISQENMNSIFEQFKQADASITKQYGGTGLGLTICKNLIELQNGTLSVSSRENMGTTFTFIIPFKKGKETDIVTPDLGALDAEKLHNKKVLLVDDDSVNRLLGKTILNKLGCSFDVAESGAKAISRLNNNSYDIVLLDIHMPDISGIDVARFLREEKQDSSTKIIAMTAAVLKRDIKTYYEVGINDFLIKPFREINLFNKMCEVLQIKDHPLKHTKAEIILKEEIMIKDDSIHKPYDLSELKRMAGGDETFTREMLNRFIDNTEHSIGAFKQLLKEKNWKQIGETAHKMLPSYRHLGIDNVVENLLDLKKKTLFEPDCSTIPSLIEVTVNAMKDIITELRKEIQQ